MQVVQHLVGGLITLGMRAAALFNPKAKKILRGRRETIGRLRTKLVADRPTIWFHAASLGEFEQGRPLIESIRERYSEWQVVVSFFSPSGYEVRHSYSGADCVVYLPDDTPRSVRDYLDAVRPARAVFIKYDFWPVVLGELHRRNVPTYLVSAIFQPRQLFFKPWGAAYRRLLHCFSYLWVQDRASVDLLARYGVYHADVAGDTRFDRAKAIAEEACSIPELEALRSRVKHLVVAGSTWREDEEALAHFMACAYGVGLVIAPHEIDEAHLRQIESLFSKAARLSQVAAGMISDYDVLIIDGFGLLASLYRYADVAYIGGGFGKGIHNSVEAAVYGLPLVFGPKIQKFREAKLFVDAGAATLAKTQAEVAQHLNYLLSHDGERKRASDVAREIVGSQLGATQTILQSLKLDTRQ